MRAILHVDKNWGIGKHNDLMFKLPLDMRYFRMQTRGGTVVMGANTFKSLPNQQPLRGRLNIVVSIDPITVPEGVITVANLQELNKVIKEKSLNSDDIWVIGGGALYRSLFPYCDQIYVTKVDADGEADVFVPNLDESENYALISNDGPYDDNGWSVDFCIYQNRKVEDLNAIR